MSTDMIMPRNETSFGEAPITATASGQSSFAISPYTKQSMRKNLYFSQSILNHIENCIIGGIYVGKLAETWQMRMKMKRAVDEANKKRKEEMLKQCANSNYGTEMV